MIIRFTYSFNENFILFMEITGLREYFGANPSLTSDSPTTIVHAKVSDPSGTHVELEDPDSKDEFYDAIADGDSLDDEDSDDDAELPKVLQIKERI